MSETQGELTLAQALKKICTELEYDQIWMFMEEDSEETIKVDPIADESWSIYFTAGVNYYDIIVSNNYCKNDEVNNKIILDVAELLMKLKPKSYYILELDDEKDLTKIDPELIKIDGEYFKILDPDEKRRLEFYQFLSEASKENIPTRNIYCDHRFSLNIEYYGIKEGYRYKYEDGYFEILYNNKESIFKEKEIDQEKVNRIIENITNNILKENELLFVTNPPKKYFNSLLSGVFVTEKAKEEIYEILRKKYNMYEIENYCCSKTLNTKVTHLEVCLFLMMDQIFVCYQDKVWAYNEMQKKNAINQCMELIKEQNRITNDKFEKKLIEEL